MACVQILWYWSWRDMSATSGPASTSTLLIGLCQIRAYASGSCLDRMARHPHSQSNQPLLLDRRPIAEPGFWQDNSPGPRAPARIRSALSSRLASSGAYPVTQKHGLLC
jgi:hypothetical protein